MPRLDADKVRNSFIRALRYWEPRRLVYNLVLLAVSISLTYRELMELVTEPPIRIVGVLVVMAIFCLIANVLYCVAYLPDVLLQLTPLSAMWQKCRWVVFSAGTVLSSIFAIVVLQMPH